MLIIIFKPSVLVILCVISLIPALLHAENLGLTSQASAIGERGIVYKNQVVFLVGSGSFWLLNDPYYYNDDGTTDLNHLRNHLNKYKPLDPDRKALGIIRVSNIGSPIRYSGINHSDKRYPCARSNITGALDGGNKFDCSKFDEFFFNHVLNVVQEADQKGIIIGIILWDEIPLENGSKRWKHNPFCPENNINNYGLPSCSTDAVPEFYDNKRSLLRRHQDKIVKKYVQVLKNEPNVFFFVSNEYTGESEWRDHVISVIENENAVNGSNLLHVTMNYHNGPSLISNGVSSDTNQPGTGNASFREDGRPAIHQRDFRTANADEKRINLWERFFDGSASGGTRDDYSGSNLPETTYDIQAAEDQHLRTFINSIISPLDELVINDSVFSSGWSGRINTNVEYVAYNKSSQKFVGVDLTIESGQWRLFEWDASAPGARPVVHELRPGGSSVTWNLNFNDSAIRIIKSDTSNVVPDYGKKPLLNNTAITFPSHTPDGGFSLFSPSESFPWKKLLFWFALIIGAVFLAYMVWRLYQNSKQTTKSSR
jgi:hypothetical protein